MNAFGQLIQRALAGAARKSGIVQRVEISAGDVDPLAWLAAQPSEDKGYWADRDHSVEIAAAGEVHTIKGSRDGTVSELFQEVQTRLQDADAGIRFYGGFRFSSQANTDLMWRPFGAYRFLLPRFEMARGPHGTTLACNFRSEDLEKAVREAHDIADAFPQWKPGLPKLLSRKEQPDRAEWKRIVESALAAITDRRIDKVVLARRTIMDFLGRVDPLAVMARLRDEMPGCFNFCGSHSGLVAFAGASPERLYRREGRALSTEALAGTRPRGDTPDLDERLGAELLASGKDRAEHQLVVDSIRESLAPLIEVSPAVHSTRILKLTNVQHLHTPIHASLRADATDADIISRLHPTPAVGGRPRDVALHMIGELEAFDRGWYSGPVGWVGRDSAEFAVAIRCGLVLGPRLCLYAGAGIVQGSQPDAEWSELDGKMRGFLNILDGR